MEQLPDNSSDLIIPERYFLIIDNKGNRKFAVTNMKHISLSKKNINLLYFNNKQLNTFWDITDNNNYIQITEKEFTSENYLEDENIEYTNTKIISSSNKEIYQSESSQKLSDNEIKQLKESISNKDDLIKTIITNNTSMEKRTILSQNKIIKKKQQKYKHLIWLTPTSLYNIIETFFMLEKQSINTLRMDTVSSMLVNSNFLPECHTMIYDDTNNILTHAYAMRTQFTSKVYHVCKENKISNKNMNIFNFTGRQKAIISYVDYDVLVNKNNFWYEMYNKKFKEYFTNLVICVRDESEIIKIFMEMYCYLKYSGNIVIFAKDIEILVAVDKFILENKMGIDTKIIETVTREYQVLPLRTHPMMNHKGFSGYVLVSFKTCSE